MFARKWARQSVADPVSGVEVPLFNPRAQTWDEHFCWNDEYVAPLTPTGRATLAALTLNRPLIIAVRREETLAAAAHPMTSGPVRTTGKLGLLK